MDRLKHILVLIVIWTYFHGAKSQLTIHEARELLVALHEGCHKTHPVDEDLIDEINLGRFPEDRQLKCYTNCMLESMRFVRKGKFHAEMVQKYKKLYAPVQFQQEWLRGVEACKDVQGADSCELSYALVQCFFQNNEHFIL